MAEYLQGDVSGHWEIVSFTNSSHLCFCYSIGIPNFQGLFWPNPCCPLSRFPPHPWLLQLLLRTKRDSVNSGLSPINHTPALDASQLCIYCHVPTTPSSLPKLPRNLTFLLGWRPSPVPPMCDHTFSYSVFYVVASLEGLKQCLA